MSTNFHLAPPPKMVDGLLAVPIDIQSINATFIFDAAAQGASADTTIGYTVGPAAGNPIFDLRQNITEAWLDGAAFPVAQLAHHMFGARPFTDLRIIESVQQPGSVHELRLKYDLALPNSEINGGTHPVLQWSPGPRLSFAFGLSDLSNARYLESWLPANLPFDQFSVVLEINIINTAAEHRVITNGAVTNLGQSNHWRISYLPHSTSVSPLLEVWAIDGILLEEDAVTLPVSGKTVTIEASKLTSTDVHPTANDVDLTAQINITKNLLTANENHYGPYAHGERFIALFRGGGMEYDGGTTTSAQWLNHETFHSWFGRGIKPAAHTDGWWDEAFTAFHDEGANVAVPFDFSDAPVVLCSRDPWQRDTPNNAYSEGNDFWKGMASLLGLANLNSLLRGLYEAYQLQPITTQTIEEFLLCRSGNAQVVDAFHRFVYGLNDPLSPVPDLWLKDALAHTGEDQWAGNFWNSPDLWIRNQDDGGNQHQSPEYGQDNWFYARVRNKPNTRESKHFVVTFNVKNFAGTQFTYPDDFLPCIAAKAEFDLPAGQTKIVRARWPREHVPPPGAHACLLASVITRSDHPSPGGHVWEHNNLAQKNLTVVDLQPDSFMILPVVIGNWSSEFGSKFDLEVWRHDEANFIDISLIHKSKELFRGAKIAVQEFTPKTWGQPDRPSEQIRVDCGGFVSGPPIENRGSVMTSENLELILDRFPEAWEATFPAGRDIALPVEIPVFSQQVLALKVAIRSRAKKGQHTELDFVQRSKATKQIVGGIAVEVYVAGKE